MAVIQVKPRVWQRDLICITKRKENQGIIRASLEYVALNQICLIDHNMGILNDGNGVPVQDSHVLCDAGTKEVQSIEPVILKFVSHCLTIGLVGETRILLTMAYNIINSSLRMVRGSSLGKRVMATNLCIKRRVRFWMSLHQGANLA